MEVFQYDFMQRALAAGLMTAVVCPLIGMFVVVRRQSFIGDGLGHIAFAGVTGGYLLGIYPPVMAVLFTVAGAVGIEWIRRRHVHYADMALAVIFYAGMALAIIFSTMVRIPSAGLLGFLFGSILTVSAQNLEMIAICSGLVALVLYILFDRLIVMALNEDIANVSGINTTWINMVFSGMTALVVVVGMTVVGVLLVSALMVIPVAAAHLLRVGFKATLLWSILFSVVSVVTGLVLSFYLDIAPGGTIVMVTVCIYIFIMLLGEILGSLWRWHFSSNVKAGGSSFRD